MHITICCGSFCQLNEQSAQITFYSTVSSQSRQDNISATHQIDQAQIKREAENFERLGSKTKCSRRFDIKLKAGECYVLSKFATLWNMLV